MFAPKYREHFANGLKLNLPRIPFPLGDDLNQNQKLFNEMTELGCHLAKIHMKLTPELNPTLYPLSNSDEYYIFHPEYNEKEQRIYFLNPMKSKKPSTWMDNISKELWDYQIGQTNQIKVWLDSREFFDTTVKRKYTRHKIMTRSLTKDDLYDLQMICSIIQHTIDLLPDIDKIYLEIEETII